METDKLITILFVVALVISIGSEIYRRRAGKTLSNKLLEALYTEKFDVFDQLIAEKRTQRLISLFNRKFLLLNKSLLKGDHHQVMDQLQEFEKETMSDVQKVAVHSKAFYYFLSCGDKKNTTKYYKLLKENKAFKDEKDLERYRKTHTGEFTLQRYKGLGEMDPDQLWETTLDPERRVLKQVEIEYARMASEITEMLMGSDVPPRRRFIYEHADEAEIDA